MAITIKKLYVKYSNFTLDVSDLKIKHGINLLIGPNGAGKTTLMESMVGLRVPEIHEIFYRDEKLKIPLTVKFKEKLAFFPSLPPIYKHKTIKYHKKLWNILYPDFDEDRYKDLMELFNLTKKKKTIELSSGERRMFFFSLLLAYSPQIFILDEPFAFLDPIQSKKMLGELISYVRENKNAIIFISSHLIDWLQKYEFYTFIIRDGKIIKDGTVEEKYETFF